MPNRPSICINEGCVTAAEACTLHPSMVGCVLTWSSGRRTRQWQA
jgi:hypothetical protein